MVGVGSVLSVSIANKVAPRDQVSIVSLRNTTFSSMKCRRYRSLFVASCLVSVDYHLSSSLLRLLSVHSSSYKFRSCRMSAQGDHRSRRRTSRCACTCACALFRGRLCAVQVWARQRPCCVHTPPGSKVSVLVPSDDLGTALIRVHTYFRRLKLTRQIHTDVIYVEHRYHFQTRLDSMNTSNPDV